MIRNEHNKRWGRRRGIQLELSTEALRSKSGVTGSLVLVMEEFADMGWSVDCQAQSVDGEKWRRRVRAKIKVEANKSPRRCRCATLFRIHFREVRGACIQPSEMVMRTYETNALRIK